MIGNGDIKTMKSRLDSFWGRIKFILIWIRESEVKIEEEKAKVEISGNIKLQFSSSGMIGIFKYRAILNLYKDDGKWVISEVSIPELGWGLF